MSGLQMETVISKGLVQEFARKHCRIQVGLLLGHINLHYMLHKMRRAKNPSCRRCGTEKEMLEQIPSKYLVLEKIKMQTLRPLPGRIRMK